MVLYYKDIIRHSEEEQAVRRELEFALNETIVLSNSQFKTLNMLSNVYLAC